VSSSGRLPAGSPARRERAETILDAAAELLRTHGYRRVSIDDVAQRASVGKGTVYLHWKTREALFWSVLQRETLRLLQRLVADLAADADLAMPPQLIRRIFLELDHRPLVRALLLSDNGILGHLASDPTVVAAQREMTGMANYLELLHHRGLLRPELSVAGASHLFECVVHGFFAATTSSRASVPLLDQADLLAYTLSHTLIADEPASQDTVADLNRSVITLFTAITDVQSRQLQDAY
jgi:AcrR family transcriptional regulator